jgi:hypothetical protein
MSAIEAMPRKLRSFVTEKRCLVGAPFGRACEDEVREQHFRQEETRYTLRNCFAGSEDKSVARIMGDARQRWCSLQGFDMHSELDARGSGETFASDHGMGSPLRRRKWSGLIRQGMKEPFGVCESGRGLCVAAPVRHRLPTGI